LAGFLASGQTEVSGRVMSTRKQYSI
jgi:hypothetical protein